MEGGSQSPSTSTEPVRTRWLPKPEQIMILEAIFNSGIVNPPKDETVRIRKMLEEFGAVGDANVFYWFQNRRRQRQLQAATAAAATSGGVENHQHMTNMSMHHPYTNNAIDNLGFGSCSNNTSYSANYFLNGCESNNGMENLFTMHGHESDHQQHHHQQHHQRSFNATSIFSPSDQNSNFYYQQGLMTVFINGVPTEVTKGAIHMKAMFGEGLVLFHSSGLPLPTDELGYLLYSLQHGQSYFLVPRQT